MSETRAFPPKLSKARLAELRKLLDDGVRLRKSVEEKYHRATPSLSELLYRIK